ARELLLISPAYALGKLLLREPGTGLKYLCNFGSDVVAGGELSGRIGHGWSHVSQWLALRLECPGSNCNYPAFTLKFFDRNQRKAIAPVCRRTRTECARRCYRGRKPIHLVRCEFQGSPIGPRSNWQACGVGVLLRSERQFAAGRQRRDCISYGF